MAEKHLSEAAWKTLAGKKKVKDNGLAKALAAYEKLGDGGDPEARLAALVDAAQLAEKLKKDKAVAAIEEVAEWLGDVVKEIAKTRVVVELLKKSAVAKKKAADGADEGKEAEDEEEDGDLGARLLAGLNRVKNGKGEAELQFAVCVAAPVLGLMVAKRITPKHKDELTAATGGKKFLLGTCIFEKEKVTFVMDPVKPGLAKQLQKSIKQFTEKAFSVRVRDSAGTTVLDGETDVDEAGGPATTGTGQPDRFVSLLPAARKALADAKESVDAQLSALQSHLKSQGDPELAQIAERGLVGVSGNLMVPLFTALQDLEGMPPASRGAAVAKAQKAVAAMKDHVATDERVLVCDDNPFGVKVSVRGTLGPALNQLEAALSAGA